MNFVIHSKCMLGVIFLTNFKCNLIAWFVKSEILQNIHIDIAIMGVFHNLI